MSSNRTHNRAFEKAKQAFFEEGKRLDSEGSSAADCWICHKRIDYSVPPGTTRAMSSTIITRCATIQTCRTIPQASATHTANATASAVPASLGSIWATSSPPGGDELHTKGLASWTTTTAFANDWP